MRVLVTAASKHGTTLEIANLIGSGLSGAGLDAVVLPADAVTTLDGFDAVVIGSGVYAGHWLEPARRLISDQSERLLGMPVWLFSSGPLGDPAKPAGDPADVADLMDQTGARGHRVFAGRIDRSTLSFGEKVIVSAVRAPSGDFRSPEDILDWAAEIAEALQPVGAAH